ncbi:MAG: dTMP kinase [Gemmatimonadaceae bacterium]
MRGRLVVFEGGEGVGKSTQLLRLASRLAAAGVAHKTYREPGGTAAGDRIRDLLLHGDAPLAPATEAALFIASRAQLVATAVRPALALGEHVLLDRFLLSTYAYQMHGRGLPEADLRAANHLATGGLVPDLTLLFQLPAAVGLERAGARGGADRMERADAAFHERVEAAFASFATDAWQAAHPECGRIAAVSAAGDASVVAERVAAAIARECPALLEPQGAGA